MGGRREEIEELARHSPAFRLAMRCVAYGTMDYETAIETLAIEKHKEAEVHKGSLLERMSIEGPPPITMPLDDFCKSYCERNHG